MTQTLSSAPQPARPPQQGSTRLVIIAILAAVFAVILVNVYVDMARKQAAGGSFVVYRVTRPLEPGDDIDARDLEAVEVSEKFEKTYEDAIRHNPYTGEASAVGEVVKRPVAMNDYLRHEHLIEDPEDKLIKQIGPGMRLIALPVDSNILPSIRPGSRVDIYARFPGSGAEPDVLAVMENVEVLVVGQRTVIEEERGERRGANQSNIRKIEITVTPEQIDQMIKIKNKTIGPFELALRSSADQSTPKIKSSGTINPEVLKKIGVDTLLN